LSDFHAVILDPSGSVVGTLEVIFELRTAPKVIALYLERPFSLVGLIEAL